MKKAIIPILLIAAIAVGVWYWVQTSASTPPGVIKVSGNIEATTVELSFRIPGWVERRYVDEGWSIAAGQIVARLDNVELIQNVKLREAELTQATWALTELMNGSRPEDIAQAEEAMNKSEWMLKELLAGSRADEIKAAEETVNADRADTLRLGADFQRIDTLHKQGAVSDQDFTTAKGAYDAAVARLAAAEAQYRLVKEGPRAEQIEQARRGLAQAKAFYELVKKGPRQEDIEQARARKAQAEESLGVAKTQLAYATLASPLSGMVLSKSTEPGEFVSPGTPIVTAADLVNIWLRAYVNETDLEKVKLGQEVEIKTDTYPGRTYHGSIRFISDQAEFTPKTVQTEKERVKLVYRIKIDIANPEMKLKPGMPADGYISTSR